MSTYATALPVLTGTSESISRYGLKKTSGTIWLEPTQKGDAEELAKTLGDLFPSPQIRTTNSGFLEMTFDAYANIGSTNGVFGTEILNLSKSFEATVQVTIGNNPPEDKTYNWTITEVWVADSYTLFTCIPSGTSSSSVSLSSPALKKTMIKSIISGAMPFSGFYSSSLQLSWATQISSITRRNYGLHDEVDIVNSLIATIT